MKPHTEIIRALIVTGPIKKGCTPYQHVYRSGFILHDRTVNELDLRSEALPLTWYRDGGFGMSKAGWKRTKFRSVILRVQGSKFLPDRMRRALLNYAGAQIHPTATVRHSCWLASADIVMGRNAMLNNFAYYDGGARLTLEDGARVAAYSIFTTSSHPHSGDPARRSSPSIIVAPITVKTGTWIMARVTVNPGVTIASGCMIGAGCVVTEDTEPNGLYVNAAGPSGTVRARRIRELGNGQSDEPKFGEGVIDIAPSLAKRRHSIDPSHHA